MSIQPSTQSFNALFNFKREDLRDFKANVIQKYGWGMYNTYLSTLFENLEVDLEAILEEIGEKSIHDEDLNYEPFLEE